MPLEVKRMHGRKYLIIRGRHGGRDIFKSARTCDRRTAEAKAAKLERELDQREIFGDEAVATFAESALGYLRAGGERRFVKLILPFFKGVKLKDVDQRMVDRLSTKAYPTAAPSTLRRQWYTPIGAVLNFGAGQRLCSPIRLRRPKDSPGRLRWLWPYEANKLIMNAAPHLRPVMTFGFGTGARAGEIISLKWKDVDLEGGQAWLWQTKSGKPRRIELNHRVVAALSALPRGEFVFLTPKNEPYVTRKNSGGQFKAGFDLASDSAGLERVTPHVMRHTWATWFYAQTGDILKLKTLGGWSKFDMVEVYAHLAPTNMGERLIKAGWDFSCAPAVQQDLEERKSI